ncbi:MAG: M24 family metallopeptidase [Syntrophorhabdaceae bacterium]|nr:M24 family metallopeptidase [Syntrophorhabdaceae bacterium]
MNEDPRAIKTQGVSDGELERRWRLVRERMEEEKIDVLIMQESNEHLGGYVKWFTDNSARNAYPMTVVFPLKDEMTTVMSGGRPPSDKGPPPWQLRGVKNRFTAPYFPSIRYSNTYDAELVVGVIKSMKRVGFVGKGKIPAAFYEYILQHMPGATFLDATDLVDEIKAIKSEEEIELIKKTCALQDELIEYAKTIIRPGRRVFEVVADVVHRATLLGSEEQLVLAGSAPLGQPPVYQRRQYQNRVIKENEPFTLLVEVNGPGGMYAEIGRIFFTGPIPQEYIEAYELCKEAQKVSLALLKPGTDPKDIWDANNEFLLKHGLMAETRLYAHGQGYDLVERPAIRDDEPMKIKANMNLAVHPTIASERLWVSVCDNYLVTEEGVSPCLHKTEQTIFEVSG